MPTHTSNREDLFPVGTSVAVYADTGRGVPASGAPSGSAISGSPFTVAADGTLTVTGLDTAGKYLLYAASPDRYLRIFVPGPPTYKDMDLSGIEDGDALGYEADTNTITSLGPVATATEGDDGQRAVVDTGAWVFRDPDVINVKLPPYNAKGDGVMVADGAITSGQATFSTASHIFLTADIGKIIKVAGAGPAGVALETTIAGVSGGNATLTANASTTVTGADAIFGTNDQAALLAACTDAGATNATTPRTVYVPHGVWLFSQLTITKRMNLTGDGWGNYGVLFGFGATGQPDNNNTILYQKWGVDDDAIIFEPAVTSPAYYVGPNILEKFMLQQDVDNSAGSGINFRDADDNVCAAEDGFRIREVSSCGFAEHGFKSGAGVPLYPENCHAFANEGAGWYANLAGNNWITHFSQFSGDQNGDGLLYCVGSGASGSRGTLMFTGIKSEMKGNVYRTAAVGDQSNAIVLHNLRDCRVVINGVNHGSPSTEDAPGAAVKITGSVPAIKYQGISVRVLGGQTGGNPVAIEDDVNSVDVPRTIEHGSYGRGSSAASCVVMGDAGKYLRRTLGGDGTYHELATPLEDAGHQVIGDTPASSLYESDGPADNKLWQWRAEGGTLKLSLIDDSGAIVGTNPGLEVTKSGSAVAFQFRGSFTLNSTVTATRSATSGATLQTFVSGDSNARFAQQAGGTQAWGSGSGAADATFGRLAADILGTGSGDKLVANGGLGVGNSAAGSSLGTVTKKMEVFDAAGTSLGFVPIYDAIT